MAKDVAKTTDGTVAPRPTETFIAYLTRRAEEESGTRAYEIAASQLDKILGSNSVDQMWDADEFESRGGRDLVDVEQRINSFTVHPTSDQYDSVLGFYVMVQAVRLADGGEFVWNTGSPLIIGKLRWLEGAEMLGTEKAECVIKGYDAPNGTVLKLRPVPKRSIPSEVS